MKKVLGIIASPRKLGNCEILVKEISRQIEHPHELTLVRLTDFKVSACRGCYLCLIKGKCVLRDDFQALSELVLNADALIVAAPTYFLGPNSNLKRVLDRGMALYPQIDRLWGKPAVGIAVAGIEGKEGYSLLGVESFLKLMLADIKMCKVVYGALPGEVLLKEDGKRATRELAQALFAPTPKAGEPSCPLCGGTTFRFFNAQEVQCILCSNTGTFEYQNHTPVFKIQSSPHDLFLSKEDAQKHKDWLLGMKHRFKDLKDDLKRVSFSYKDDGNWALPGEQTRNGKDTKKG